MAQKQIQKKQQKDRVFVIVLAIVLASLVLSLPDAIEKVAQSVWNAGLLFADGIAIIGVLYLLRTYRRARKYGKEEQASKEEHTSQDL